MRPVVLHAAHNFGAVSSVAKAAENVGMALPAQAWTRSRLTLLEQLMARLAVKRDGPAHLATGKRGELAAYFHLRRLGWVIVARGWRSHIVRGDLDLIGWERDTLCFIEVKSRNSRDVATAEAAVDEDKRRNLRRLARRYCKQLGQPLVATRFDIVSVYFEGSRAVSCELFRGAFE
jgi:putative endonuclease